MTDSPVATLTPWLSAGPVLDEELQRQVEALVNEVGPDLGVASLVQAPDYACAEAVLARLWSSLLADNATVTTEQARERLEVASRLRTLDRRMADLRVARGTKSSQRLSDVLTRLEAATCSVSGLVALAPQLICELGFDRGLISRVTNAVWQPELMYVVGDPDWAAEITKVGKTQPQVLRGGLYEAEIVRTGKAILVSEPQADPRRGHRGMIEASLTHSYIAAPILSGREVVGILTADRYGQRQDVDELDLQLLVAFTEGFRLALSRAALADQLETLQHSLASALGSVDRAFEGLHAMPSVRVTRAADDHPDGVVMRSGPRFPVTAPLPDGLTHREMEVLRLMAAGRTNLAIARQLSIADGTVKQHVKHILRKLSVGNRSEAVARWFQAGGETNDA